jgi:outer membrane protein OmpA-like peptidoglycan-associated protein
MTAKHLHFLAVVLRRPLPTAALSVGLAALLAVSLPADAQQPMNQTTVDALVNALSSGPATRSFKRTQLPDVGSSLCAEQAVAAAANPAAPSGSNKRNLEVVPYAGDTTPGVNLSVQFANASDKLTAPDRALLDTLATALKRPELAGDSFAVAGHTDTTGDARINLELSCARALAVRRYLMAKGVAEPRLSAYGFGSTRLLADTAATSGTHRRVEIRKAPQ